jgi:hypothetical protein
MAAGSSGGRSCFTTPARIAYPSLRKAPANEVVELRLLANPKKYQKIPERQKAHEVRQEPWRESQLGAPEVVVAVNGLGCRYAKVQHEQRHRHSENAIAQGRQSFYVLPCDLAVRRALGKRTHVSFFRLLPLRPFLLTRRKTCRSARAPNRGPIATNWFCPGTCLEPTTATLRRRRRLERPR